MEQDWKPGLPSDGARRRFITSRRASRIKFRGGQLMAKTLVSGASARRTLVGLSEDMEREFTPQEVVRGKVGYDLEEFRQHFRQEIEYNLPRLDTDLRSCSLSRDSNSYSPDL